MKSNKYLVILIIFLQILLSGCASTVKDLAPVRSGEMSLIKGKKFNYIADLLIPLVKKYGVYITEVDGKGVGDSENDSAVEVLVSPGKHVLKLSCEISELDFVSHVPGSLEVNVKGGFIYQIGEARHRGNLCFVDLNEVGLIDS